MFDRTLPALVIAGGALALGTAAAATAQTTAKPAAPATPQNITRTMVVQKLDQEFKELDTNKDGSISSAEFDEALK